MGTAATELERLVLDLINESRADAGLDPLFLELNLNEAADDHSQWMTDTRNFTHVGAGGSQPHERMIAAGADLSGTWGATENIAAHPNIRARDNLAAQAKTVHDGFMNSASHRANILDPEFTHVGIGIKYGPMNFTEGGTLPALIVTQNFAFSGGKLDDDLPPPNEVSGTSTDETLPGSDDRDVLSGLGGDDTLKGLGGDDTLKGGKGDDVINGGNGDDSAVGQAGDDTINGGNGDDTLKGGGGADVINGGDGNDFLKGGTKNDTLTGGNGSDRIFGNRHDDVLNGSKGNDTLNGGGENDTLDGGVGNDRLKGGDGADVFIFNDGNDRIEDYNPNQDRIELDAALYGTDAGAVIADLTTLTSTGAVIDFGGDDVLVINGEFTLAQLEADITFI